MPAIINYIHLKQEQMRLFIYFIMHFDQKETASPTIFLEEKKNERKIDHISELYK
jgi:hypothetical protein